MTTSAASRPVGTAGDSQLAMYISAALTAVIARRNTFDDSPETVEHIAKQAVAIGRAIALEVARTETGDQK